MKNSEIVSAVVGGTFFAVPYLALGVSVLPSLAIGAAAFAAGELVFRTNVVQSLKETAYKKFSDYYEIKEEIGLMQDDMT